LLEKPDGCRDLVFALACIVLTPAWAMRERMPAAIATNPPDPSSE